jgi:hypothetical protein
MGWFILSVIIGFLSFWTWRFHSTSNAPPHGLSDRVSRFISKALVESLPATMLFGVLIIAAGWAVLSQLDRTYWFSPVLDLFARGTPARLLLGFVFGFGFAYMQERLFQNGNTNRITEFPPNRDARGRPIRFGLTSKARFPDRRHIPAEDKRPAGPQSHLSDIQTEGDSSAGSLLQTGKSTLLTVALIVIVFALAAPHLDNWLHG